MRARASASSTVPVPLCTRLLVLTVVMLFSPPLTLHPATSTAVAPALWSSIHSVLPTAPPSTLATGKISSKRTSAANRVRFGMWSGSASKGVGYAAKSHEVLTICCRPNPGSAPVHSRRCAMVSLGQSRSSCSTALLSIEVPFMATMARVPAGNTVVVLPSAR